MDEAPVSTAPPPAPISQEILRLKDYDLADEFKFNIDDQDNSLFVSDSDSDTDGEEDLYLDSEDDCKNLISFALPPLTGYTEIYRRVRFSHLSKRQNDCP